MGRRSSKERVTLQYFEKEEQRLTALTPEIGSVIRIGKPSNRYYQYIFSSLDFLQQKISDLAELLDIEGMEVEITGFIKLKGSHRLAVVQERLDEGENTIGKKLFIEIKNALEYKEIIIEN